MTSLLYIDNPFQVEFSAEVKEVISLTDGKIGAILPATYFYPTGGGQSHDTGSIGEAKVVDVYKQDEQVIHVLDRPLSPGRYPATVDRDRRLRAMQHHTGQHLLSAVFLHILELGSVSATINAYTPSSVDIEALDVAPDQLARVELVVNQLICENRLVKSYFITDEDVPKIPFRKPPKVSGQIRVVEVEGYDHTPCGGTHCLQTGSIGLLKIVHTERMNRKFRVHFVAGFQALEVFHQLQTSTQQAAALLRTRPENVVEGLQRLQEQFDQAHQENEKFKMLTLDAEAAQLVFSAEPVGEVHVAVRYFPERASAELRSLAARLNTRPGIVSVLASSVDQKFNLVVSCPPGCGMDARQLLQEILRPIGGRGGGDARDCPGWGAVGSLFTIIPAGLRKYMDTLEEINQTVLTCRLCPRLVAWREKVALEKRRAYHDQVYWGRPVPGFGDPQARLFVIGLAPGAHGSNRTGRQFTGDASGDFFYPALFRAGFASQPGSISIDDGLELTDLYTAPVCRCAPPDNKPTVQEMLNCSPYLEREIELIQPQVFVALGRIAFDALLRIHSIHDTAMKFAHNAAYPLPGERWMICSYHPSRQNTQTGRLTMEMFEAVWEKARTLLKR